MKKASIRMEKLVWMMSPMTPKATSSSEGTMVVKNMVSSPNASVRTSVGNAGAEKPPPPCSLRRRAVANPHVNTRSSGTC